MEVPQSFSTQWPWSGIFLDTQLSWVMTSDIWRLEGFPGTSSVPGLVDFCLPAWHGLGLV